MNEMDLKFNNNILSIEYFRDPKKLILESVFKLKKSPFYSVQKMKLSSSILFINDINVQKFNEFINKKYCPISKFCSQKQETESLTQSVQAMKKMGC